MSTIAVGMSGGLDSTMTALLLKKQGHKVIGITMATWDDSIAIAESSKSGCFGPGEADDLLAAASACAKLGIEHHVIHLKHEFRDNVLDYFCSTYLDGKTPNPCLMCNKRLKFGLLPQRAKEMGLEFDFFATGHYVKKSFNSGTGRWELYRATDRSKDQSYFLSFLSQEQLSACIFVLGELRKHEIRKLAIEAGFEELAGKQESQDFLETDDYSVLFEANSFAPGDILDLEGKVLGTHRGLINYTIGQRKNLGIAGQSEAYYVLAIDSGNNTITVGPKSHLYSDELIADAMNWISISAPRSDFEAQARIRLQHEPSACKVSPREGGSYQIKFYEAQLSITPGQGIVLYDGELVLGGGFIR